MLKKKKKKKKKGGATSKKKEKKRGGGIIGSCPHVPVVTNGRRRTLGVGVFYSFPCQLTFAFNVKITFKKNRSWFFSHLKIEHDTIKIMINISQNDKYFTK